LYQLFVGEIGISRREFLYEIKAWEARRIVKGYQRRNILHYQLQRMQVWASMFCMGNPEKKSPTDILHLYFDDFDKDEAPVSEDEIRQMQEEMVAINLLNERKARRKKKKKQ
jgi:hypothetical protein